MSNLTASMAWTVGAVARQPIYASLVGLGAATEFVVAVGAIAPARILSERAPKGPWVSALVGLAKELAGGFDPVKASQRAAGFDGKECMAMAGCGLALLADRWRRKLGVAMDALDDSSPRGAVRKAWRAEKSKNFQAGADATVEAVLDAPRIALGRIKGKLAALRSGREDSAAPRENPIPKV